MPIIVGGLYFALAGSTLSILPYAMVALDDSELSF